MTINKGRVLLRLARQAMEEALAGVATAAHTVERISDAAWLRAPGATFVTLMQRGELRGCIGTLLAHRPLRADVQANAVAAALRDPRFPPMVAAELAHTDIEVSLLSTMQPLHAASEADALVQLRPGIDGLFLESGVCRATFLPQVWEQLPEPRDFMAHLKDKAGLARAFWGPDVRLKRYTVGKWRETSIDRGEISIGHDASSHAEGAGS